ncbi:hypothetical protein [Leucobacter japonicus]|uniref:hypothetical protein n=1 Tax=Leucobacter japonicus TaxID=1461259 RepID=UPI0006A7E3F2|nr:hypothetical protein [Leucobacter japonicus]
MTNHNACELPRKLTCDERDAILHADGRYEGWSVAASLTDAYGEFGDPRIETTWERDGRRIKDVRHPHMGSYSPPDRKPCEHTELEPEIEEDDE